MAEPNWQHIQDLFERAVALDGSDRVDFLDRNCETDSEQRRIIDKMLRADAAPPSLLYADPGELAALLPEEKNDDDLPSQIGPYQVEKLIGRGGMGIVLLAQRPDLPRKVALKLVRDRWLDSKSRGRFRREQAMLARLQHPHIARLLNVGTAEDGTPYLTMDYIEGSPITEYCDAKDLGIGDRLLLILDVCDAAQFAHQNLVVHRDLKPSNIMVDRSGSVKLLDFGISKLLGEDESTGDAVTGVITQTAQRLMTPSYASPEQLRGEQVSTATDVYSLGVVLYEILAGRRPYDVDGKSATEASRIVTEEMPARPSAVASLPDRQRRLKGDLDNIVLKALQKDPVRRYISIDALAADIRRHLEGQPVEAYEAGLPYRLQKFASRHRWGVTVALVALLLLVGFAGAMTIQQAATAKERDRAERETARAERTSDFLMGLFEASDPSEARGDTVTASQLLERGIEHAEALPSDQPLLKAETFDVIGQVYRSLGQNEKAVGLLQNAVDLRRANGSESDPGLAASLRHISQAFVNLRLLEEAEQTAQEALILDRARNRAPDESIAHSLTSVALALEAAGDYAASDSLLQIAHDQLRLILSSDNAEVVAILANRVPVLMSLGSFEQAEIVIREVIDWRRRNLPSNHPDLAESLDHLAVSLRNQSKFEEAKPFYEESLSIKREVYGDVHPSVAAGVMNLGIFHGIQGDYVGAEPYFKEAVAIYTEAFGADSPRTARSITSYAVLLARMGRYEEAAERYRLALEIQEKNLGEKHPDAVHSLYNLGMAYAQDGQFNKAIPLLERTVRLNAEVLGTEHHRYAESIGTLGLYEAAAGRLRYAELHTRKALALSKRNTGIDDANTARLMSYLGRVLLAKGDYVQADSILTVSIELFAKHSEPNHPSAIAMTDALGRTKMHLEAFAEADSLLSMAYSVRLERLGPAHPWTKQTAAHREELYRKWTPPLHEDGN